MAASHVPRDRHREERARAVAGVRASPSRAPGWLRDASREREQRAPEQLGLLLVRALEGCRILHAPVRRDRLPGPDRARLSRGLVADGEHEIEERGPGRPRTRPSSCFAGPRPAGPFVRGPRAPDDGHPSAEREPRRGRAALRRGARSGCRGSARARDSGSLPRRTSRCGRGPDPPAANAPREPAWLPAASRAARA